MFVGISKSDLSSFTHVVLEILPADAGGEVLHDDSVWSAGGWAVLYMAESRVAPGPAVKPGWSAVSVTVSPIASIASPPGKTSSMLHRHPFSQQLTAIHFIHSVISITLLFELHKAISILNEAVTQAAVTLEEPFKITFPAVVVQPSNVHPSHLCCCLLTESSTAGR